MRQLLPDCLLVLFNAQNMLNHAFGQALCLVVVVSVHGCSRSCSSIHLRKEATETRTDLPK
jgi:hypothetical protein